MFQLDEEFLRSIGLDGMSKDKKAAFLAHAQEELEMRVGVKMSEGLAPEQVDEFERIIDGDEATVKKVIGDADLKNDKIYHLLIDRAGFKEGSKELANEFASIKWLTENRPDYQQIVSDEIEGLKKEIAENKDSIA
ncbi:MAG: DUF5663 domain-containing protein [Candidatus Nomurabacteria bacterium]|jgi:hypothetical protein|nr:DUF5663 domain-containing protein [Candidatus Nomurabacteria bacterium]